MYWVKTLKQNETGNSVLIIEYYDIDPISKILTIQSKEVPDEAEFMKFYLTNKHL